MQERSEPGTDDPPQESPKESPIPPDAPVETPEADPRTEHAPDPQGPGTADPDGNDDDTEQQIGEAFR